MKEQSCSHRNPYKSNLLTSSELHLGLELTIVCSNDDLFMAKCCMKDRGVSQSKNEAYPRYQEETKTQLK